MSGRQQKLARVVSIAQRREMKAFQRQVAEQLVRNAATAYERRKQRRALALVAFVFFLFWSFWMALR